MDDLEIYHKWNDKALELFNLMRTTPQSPVHHGEGAVYIHTQMVVEEVKNNFPLQSNLLNTALLHDIAKPLTTIFEEGEWRSPGHAKLGEPITREILWDILDFEERENVSSMVRLHGLPIWFNQKQNPKEAIIKASLRCNLVDLANFARCDFKGRICEDAESNFFTIELFEEQAEILNCLNNPYPFVNDWARLSFFKRETHETAPIWEPDGAWFVVMCGMPGSGKNTWVKKNWHGKIVEMDAIRQRLKIKSNDKDAQGLVHQTAKEELREALRQKKDVLWNATNLTELQRSTIIDIALNYKAKIKIVYLDCSIEKALGRNKTREEDDQIPFNVIEKMYRKLEVPTLAECHQLEIIK